MFENQTFDILDKIGAERTPDGVLGLLNQVTESAGFSAFCLSAIPDPGIRMDSYVMLSGWSEEWFSHYMAKDYVQEDPVIQKLRATARPFSWGSVFEDPQPLSKTAKRIMNEACEFKMYDGLCVPIFSARGFQAGMSFGGERTDLTEREAGALHLISISAYNRIRDLVGTVDKTAPVPKLTARERECLKWTSAGKTSWEISQILSISQHTVDWYLTSAARKLGAANRTHAVAEGFRKGLLH
ncbi:MAG: LuxR family transcriptional regulator [Hyphomicrobiales bacterium]|nr:MAG: LuxR family transcriptional regulator [Hyphomicrobiales bacterium]